VNVSLPHDREAERALLGTILTDNAAFYTAAEYVSKGDFFSEANRICWGAIEVLLGEGREVDLVALTSELERQGLLDKCGGPSRIAGLSDGVPLGAGAPVREYCRIIREKARLRSLLALSRKVGAEVSSGRKSDEVLASAESCLAEIRGEQEEGERGAVPVSQVVAGCMPVLDRTAGKGLTLGTRTGFPGLDNITAGWMPSDFVIVAGRPSEGKTALALEFLRRTAKAGIPGAIFSLEMNREALALRLVCREAKVDHHKFRAGFFNKDEWARLTGALADIAKLALWIDDRPAPSISDLRWRIRSLAKRTGVKLFVVDYLQLLQAKAENRTQDVTRISMELKAAARDLGEFSGGTLIAVSQLSRNAANERPKLHHLRESGQLEQDADVVIFISNAAPAENGQEEPSKKLIDIAKQRNGPCGSFSLMFLPRGVGFEECSPDTESVTVP
jgi:replicative DNA helicase